MADIHYIDAPIATMFKSPDLTGEPINTLLYGERVSVENQKGDVDRLR